jgi:cell division protein FtsQ
MFPIKEVTFVGQMERVDKSDLESVAGGIRGSMLHTDLNDVKAAIKQVHWVRNAEVRRRFPSTLEVSIEEHRPFAKWKEGDSEQSLLVNNFGEVFAADFDGPLPVLSGPDGSAKEVLARYDTFKLLLAPISQTPAAIVLSPRRAWQLRLGNGSTLELGRAEAVERLSRYVAAFASVPALQTANARIDMRYQSGMALKLADAALAKPAAAAAKKSIKKATAKL